METRKKRKMGKTQYICVIALGVSLFVALTLVIQVPIFENYYICLGYLVMLVYMYEFGTVADTAVGVLGVTAYCILTSGLRGLPGWALGNFIIGILQGKVLDLTREKRNGTFYGINIISIAMVTFLGIMLAKSALESILYAQTLMVRAAKNVYGFVADAIVMLLGLPFLSILDRAINRAGLFDTSKGRNKDSKV